MHVNVQNDTWRCNYCNESGGMLSLYARLHNISNREAYREICDAILNGEGLSGHSFRYPSKTEIAPVENIPIADAAVMYLES